MLLIWSLTLLFALLPWWRQRAVCCSSHCTIKRLVLVRKEARKADRPSLTVTVQDSLDALLAESLSHGYRIADAVTHAVQWLRLDAALGEKANRLRLLWSLRLLVVLLIAGGVRSAFSEETEAAVIGISGADWILTAVGCGVLVCGSMMFYRLVPLLEQTQDGVVKGLVIWLRHRINAENGHLSATIPEILHLEDEEVRSGISLQSDKIDALDTLWRSRISLVERACESALELMPVFEFITFGIFLLTTLSVPLAQKIF